MRKLVLLLLVLIGASGSAVAREPIDTGAVRAALAQAYNLPESSSWGTVLLAPAQRILADRLDLMRPLTWPDLEKLLRQEQSVPHSLRPHTTTLEVSLRSLVVVGLGEASGSDSKILEQLVADFLRKEGTKITSEHTNVLNGFLHNFWTRVFADIPPHRRLCARPARCT